MHYLPEEIKDENARAISDYTFSVRAILWMNNMGQNMPDIRRGKRLGELRKKIPPSGSALVIGAGPSIEKYSHLEILAESGYRGAILCCDRMLIPLLKKGIVPDVVASVDGSPEVADFFRDPLVDEHVGELNVVFCAQSTHPDTVKAFKGAPFWFVAIWDDPINNARSITRLFHWMTGDQEMMNTGGNVGSFLWNVGYMLGKNPIGLIGLDMGYSEEDDLTKTTYYAYLRRMLELRGKDPDDVPRFYRRGYNPDFRNNYYTDILFESYVQTLKRMIDESYKKGLRTYNCTGQGALHGGKVKGIPLKDFLKKYESYGR